MTVALTNTTRRPIVLLLPHAWCEAGRRCTCSRRRDGRLLPHAVTLPARCRVGELPDDVLKLPAIAEAVRAGALRVEHVPSTGGPEGALTSPVEVSDERRAPLVQSRRR